MFVVDTSGEVGLERAGSVDAQRSRLQIVDRQAGAAGRGNAKRLGLELRDRYAHVARERELVERA